MLTWREHLGRDRWKNLIAEECRFAGNHSSSDKAASLERGPIPAPPLNMALGHMCLTGDGAPATGASYLVFHAGRYFLAGASCQAIERLRSSSETLRIRRLHVLLLSWNPDHQGGLPKLQQWGVPFTIWSSRWIWDEWCKSKPSLRELEAHDIDGAPVQPVLEPNDIRDTAPLPVVRTFEELLDVTFTIGVHLRLRYTLSPQEPSLCAEFRCAGKRILVDPFRGTADLASFNDTMAKLVREWPELNDKYSERVEQIADIFSQAHCGGGRDWTSADVGTLDMSVRGASLDEVRLKPPPTAVRAIIRDPAAVLAESSGRPRPKVGVIILCGALLRRERAELIDPGRVLRIPAENTTVIMSILEWRLRQVHSLLGDKTRIFLKTSPDTEPIVHRILRRLEPNLRDAVELIPSWLTPLYTLDQKNALQPAETADGGWVIKLGGHLNGLQALVGRPDLPDMLLVLAHNNLGCILDEATKAEVFAAWDAPEPVTVEVFEMRAAEGSRDDRWASFSYLKDHYLWKSEYDGTEVVRTAAFSSMTCYFKSRELARIVGSDVRTQIGTADVPHKNSWVVRSAKDGAGRVVYWVGRDIDLITHGSDPTRYVIYRSDGDGLYSHPRFFSVRKEDHLRDAEFWTAFREAARSGIPVKSEYYIDEHAVRERNIWELVPVEKRYVWGGTRIARMKGDPHYWSHPIAETWEVSTHESGPASCLLDIRRSIPFSEVVRICTGGADCTFMAKYLDCKERLSIQVHPNRLVAKFLAEKTRLKVSDERGKEETFYVIEPAAERSIHLFLGFSEERLEPLAALIRPSLHALWHRADAILSSGTGRDNDSAFNEIYPLLLSAMRTAAKRMAGSIRKYAGDTFAPEDFIEAQLLRTFAEKWQPRGIEPHSFREPLYWHLIEHPRLQWSEGLPWSLLGREYLFAALAVVRIIEELALYARAAPATYETALRLFDYDSRAADVGPASNIEQHPVFRYFQPITMRKGSWGRVPAGTIHAWQDGGNSLIEIADNSDNTFRVLDFGRELKYETLREMHYTQAMYALTDESIVGPAAIQKLILPPRGAHSRGQELRPTWHGLHARVEHLELHGEGNTIKLDSESYACMLNPEGTVEFGSDSDLLRVPPASAVFIARPRGTVVRTDREGLLIAVRPRTTPRPVICVSFGASRVEVAVWEPGGAPSARWRHATLAAPADTPDQTIDTLSSLGRTLKLDAENAIVGICWPGPVDLGNDRCYSLTFTDHDFSVARVKGVVCEGFGQSRLDFACFANDAFLSAHGERRHPRGRASIGRSLLLNLGTGLCAGWLNERAAFDPFGYLGRWLYVDAVNSEFWRRAPGACRSLPVRESGDRTGRFVNVAPDEALRNDVFTPLPDVDLAATGGPAALRSSVYFSYGSLAIRWLGRLNHDSAKQFLAQAGHRMPWRSDEPFADLARRITRDPINHPRFLFIQAFNQILNDSEHHLHRDARSFLTEFAYDLARCVQVLQSGQRIGAEFGELVLTGSLGENFGRAGETDVLLELMHMFLPTVRIYRSRIATSILRELAGVVALAEANAANET